MKPGKLQLSNGYNLNFDQMAQFLAAIEKDGRTRIPFGDVGEAIGIPPRQAENVGSLASALGLIKPITYQLTELARVINANDRFFDDLGTLWFLHYVIAAEPRHIVWNRFANELVPQHHRFTRADFRGAFNYLAESHSRKSALSHVLKEVNVALNAYTEQNFSKLAYLMEDGEQYGLSYREPIPPLVLAACMVRYRDQHRPGDTALSISDLLSAPNSPGVVCQIAEDRLRSSLEALKTRAGLSLESRADLDQVRFTDNTRDYQWMERYYVGR